MEKNNDLLNSLTLTFVAQMDAAMEIANKISQEIPLDELTKL